MPNSSLRHLALGGLIAALGWGCSPEKTTAPSAEAELSTTTAASYTIRDLGTLGGTFSQAFGINNAGAVVGMSSLAPFPDDRVHAFVWKNGVMTDLRTLAGARESQANAINQDGTIVGWSRNAAGDMRAIRWKDGKKRSLGTLGGQNSQALAINVFGVIVGWSETAGGNRHAFKWENGVMTDLGTMMGGTSSVANGINRAGAIVGASTTAASGDKNHAFKWKSGVFKDLGTGGTQSSVATAVNTKGQIAGVLGPPIDAAGEEQDFTQGFVFYQDVMTRCCRFRHPTTTVHDINPAGIVVGMEEDVRAEDVNDTEDAWIYENGVTRLLPELAVGHSGAFGTNLAGNVAGYSENAAGRIHAVLWRRQ